MHPQTKKKLIAFYLKHKFGEIYQESWLDNIANYGSLDEAIERMDDWGPNFLKVAELEPTHPNFSTFAAILDGALQFSNTIPPVCTGYDEEKLDQRMDLADELKGLPNTDYTRRVAQHLPANHDEEFEYLKEEAVRKLLSIAKQTMPHLKLDTYKDLRIAIENHEKLLSKNKGNQQLISELNLLNDLNKIARLEIFEIPKQDGSPAYFCTLPEKAGGVTEKISLIGLDEVKQKLRNIQQEEEMGFSEYTDNRNNFTLSTKAILKLPKHEKTTEVQREAIALNISRILGFTTTNSNMVQFQGKAALFVPFDQIQLLSEFARGTEETVVLPSGFSLEALKKIGDKYQHYASIIPVGNELNSDKFIEDLGKIEAFSYLCNDPDFIGMMAGQNKGIKDGQSLYVFDQVTMEKDRLEIDTRFSLVPVGFGRHTRHYKGRNRTLVDDSSFDSKVESFAHLFESQPKINFMLDEVISAHQTKIRQIENAIAGLKSQRVKGEELETLKKELTELKTLEKDAIKIKTALNRRLDSTFKNFPPLNGHAITPTVFLANKNLIKSSLLLEKLVNNPVLFSDDGRPYRNPWTYRNTNNILSIRENAGMVSLTFANFDAEQLIYILGKNGVDLHSCKKSKNTLHIPATELAKLTETSLFPALRAFNQKEDYTNIEDLRRIAKGYPEGLQDLAISRIEHYKFEVMSKVDPVEKAKAMKSALDAIQRYCVQETNKGFLKHVELNLQMDIQKQLRQIIHDFHADDELEAKVAEAFDAAVKLDRLDDFNRVLITFAISPEGNKKNLMTYLNKCIDHGLKATNYNLAKQESEQMQQESVAPLKIKAKKPMESPVKMLDLMGASSSGVGAHKKEEPHLEFDERLDEEDANLDIKDLHDLTQTQPPDTQIDTKLDNDKPTDGIPIQTAFK